MTDPSTAFVDKLHTAYLTGTPPSISETDILDLLNDWSARAAIVGALRQARGNDPDQKQLVLEFLAELAAGLDHLAHSDENWIETLDKVAFPLGIGGLLAAAAGLISGGANLMKAGLIVGSGAAILGAGVVRFLLKRRRDGCRTKADRIRRFAESIRDAV